MDVEATVDGDLQDRARQDESIRGYHHHVGGGSTQSLEGAGHLQRRGLVERNRERRGRLRNLARGERKATPRGAVGLREYEGDVVARGHDRFEGPRREGGRARENYAEIRPPCADAS